MKKHKQPKTSAATIVHSTQGSWIGKLPLETREMIFLLLHPQDLVSCMYAYADVHSYLTTPEGTPKKIWHAVFNKHTAFTCPKGFPADKFAEFLFGSRCMTCQKSHRYLRSHFTLLARNCPACYAKELVRSEWICRKLLKPGEQFNCKAFLPKDEYDLYSGKRGCGPFYSLFFAKIVIENYRSHCRARPDINIPGSARDLYTRERQSDVNEIQKAGQQARKYMLSHTSVEDFTQSARYHDILERLMDEPEKWTACDFPTGSAKWERWMSREGSLTNKAWKDLYSRLKPVLEREREKKGVHIC